MLDKVKNTDKRWIWILLGLLTILIGFLVGNHSPFVENVYSRGLFLFIRMILDYTIALIPFPCLYVLIILLLIFLLVKTRRMIKSDRTVFKKLEVPF